ncbi:hypothetical protein BG005_001860 [Podila minutissima]|nr:hypothetical protein BG005_001860 [Podila minutissima]
MLGANIGLNHQKLYCSSACHPLLERQLWRFESGFLINHCTGLVLDVDGLQYKTNTRIMQWSRSNPETNTNQQWDVSHGLIHVKGKPNLVLGVDGNAACDDTSIRIGERKNNDLNQLWSFEAVTFPSLTSQTGDSHTAKTDKRISNEYESSPLARVLDVEHSPQNRQLKEAMSVFLRDIYSVDTQFVFKSADKTTSNTRLWAHRSILAKYTVFDDLLKQAALASIGSNVAPLSVSVAKVTFAAFAALLKFFEAGWNSQVNNGGLKDRHRWHPLDLVTPLSDEPITWQELLDAATIYKLDALRARCETALKLITKVSVTSSTDVRPTLSTYTKEELFD